MGTLDTLVERAAQAPAHIVLPEGEDARIAAAAVRAVRAGIARVTLLGDEARVRAAVQAAGGSDDDLAIVDPAQTPRHEDYAASFHDLRKHKGLSEEGAASAVREPLMLAALMVRTGEADGTVGGAVYTTSDTVRAALQVIGRAPGAEIVSSFFLMVMETAHHARQGAVIYSDCGLVVEPSAEELCVIAQQSAASFSHLIGGEPRVAMLSFSTSGSARHERVTKVATATEMLRAARPDLRADGDIQFDAAFVPEVNAKKVEASQTEGLSNVMIFPSLEAGNIAYKITERIGGAVALGPILQGLARPANDLSRGCSAQDVFYMIAVTVLQARAA